MKEALAAFSGAYIGATGTPPTWHHNTINAFEHAIQTAFNRGAQAARQHQNDDSQ